MKKEECIEKYGLEAYQKRLEQTRKWKREHSEQRREYNRKWIQEHPEQAKEQQRKWREENRERYNEQHRNYERQNRAMFAFVIPEEKELIENYEMAKADNFDGWDVHHRLETHTSDGELRLAPISMKELKALDMYYNRPATELILLTKSEHMKLHRSIKK